MKSVTSGRRFNGNLMSKMSYLIIKWWSYKRTSNHSDGNPN